MDGGLADTASFNSNQFVDESPLFMLDTSHTEMACAQNAKHPYKRQQPSIARMHMPRQTRSPIVW